LKVEDLTLFTNIATITLLHLDVPFTIPAHQLMAICSLFQENLLFLDSTDRVQSPVSLLIFRECLSILEGNTLEITATNLTGFERLSPEFGVTELASNLIFVVVIASFVVVVVIHSVGGVVVIDFVFITAKHGR
jgi:hypothetical protein